MYLSKLRIVGFKSFANKVEVNFPGDGITSVVGPNGCGKSNIIDAIRWVLGEQRAKALRSTRMEDVIFSGTAEKPPMSLAEVSLIIDNSSGVLPSDYTQIMITRRAYRSGDSEYLINNQACRLKDIHNLFYDTGMGAASYSLIEARMIDSILSDKPEERRNMFEEAAGISKYKQQRKETLRQLERTAADLARVEDNLRHIRQNVSMFERQARKAERWKELRESYVGLELSHQYDTYKEISAKYAEHKKELEQSTSSLNDLQNRISTQEAVLEERKLTMVGEEEDLNRLNRVVAGTNGELVRISSATERSRDRIAHLQESIASTEQQLEALAQKVVGFAMQKDNVREEITQLEQEQLRLRSMQENQGEAWGEFRNRYQEGRKLADSLGEQRVRFLEGLSSVQHKLSTIRAERNHLVQARDTLEQEAEEAAGKEKELREEDALNRKSEEELTQRSQELQHEKKVLAESISVIEADLRALRETLRDCERRRVAIETHFRLLEKMMHSMEGMQKGTRYLLQEHKDKIKGMLADRIRVEGDSIALVEKCLGDALQILVVDDADSAADLLDTLLKAGKGEASLSWTTSTWKRAANPVRPPLEGCSGFLGWLSDEVECDEELRPTVRSLLGRFARVSNRQDARALLAEHGEADFWIALESGEIWHSAGWMRGGAAQAKGDGLLQRKADFERTGKELETVVAQNEELAAKTLELETQLAADKEESKSLEEQMQTILQGLQECRGKRAVIESSLDNAEAGKEQSDAKLRQSRERLAEIDGELESAEAELAEAEKQRSELEESFQAALANLHRYEEEKLAFEEKLRGLDQDKGNAETQVKSLRHKLDYLERSEQEQHALREKLQQQKIEWLASVEDESSKIRAFEEEIGELHKRLENEEKERDKAKEAYDGKMVHLDEIRVQIKRYHEELQQWTRSSHEKEMKLQQAQAVMSSIHERMFELHEIDLNNEESLDFQRVEYDPQTVEKQIRELKEQLKRLGNVNTGALEDYESEKQRLEEVEGQFDDLNKARVGLERAIRKLDKVAREQFLETFAIVQKNFQEVFSSLFEGGEAHVSLDESMDPLDAKIEINARPTGKKMRGVTLLSGGERALTAISLLFALYLVKPSPYCIMDEVDGPLDDANIGRFVNLLRRFSHQTQFIVVTHNKRTMAASDMLYGVTQEVKGISRLVSVQLNEATRIAA